MAVSVFEQAALRQAIPIRQTPAEAFQSLTVGGAASAAFKRQTCIVSIYSDVACNVAFSPKSGVAPTATDVAWPIAANTYCDFSVIGGRQVIAF